MVKINIITGEPFQFLDHGEPVVQICFDAEDMRSDNRARNLPRWSENLDALVKSGYIEIIEGGPDVVEIEQQETAQPETVRRTKKERRN